MTMCGMCGLVTFRCHISFGSWIRTSCCLPLYEKGRRDDEVKKAEGEIKKGAMLMNDLMSDEGSEQQDIE